MRVLPAQHRRKANDLATAHVDLGLELQAQLSGIQRLTHPFDRLVSGVDLAVAAHVEQVKALATALLGHVHGLIGMTQQGPGIFVVVRKERDANTGKHIDVLAVQ
ncbi:hypothetical protein D9M71_782220 [compost metagenome]